MCKLHEGWGHACSVPSCVFSRSHKAWHRVGVQYTFHDWENEYRRAKQSNSKNPAMSIFIVCIQQVRVIKRKKDTWDRMSNSKTHTHSLTMEAMAYHVKKLAEEDGSLQSESRHLLNPEKLWDFCNLWSGMGTRCHGAKMYNCFKQWESQGQGS